MPLSFPPEADTLLKKFIFLRRVHRCLILRHQQVRRLNFPAEMTSEQIAQFKEWERDTWLPRMKRCTKLIHQYRVAVADDFAAYDVKTQQQEDTTWDYAIQPDEV